MKLNFFYNLNDPINNGDASIQNALWKKLTLEKLLDSYCLKHTFKGCADINNKLKLLSIGINDECEYLQIIHLDIRGNSKSLNFKRMLSSFPNGNQKIENIAFVFMSIKKLSFDNKSNSVAIFCDLELKGSSQDPEVILRVRRIETINIPYLSEELVWYKTEKFDLTFTNVEHDSNKLALNEFSDFLKLLNLTEKIIDNNVKSKFKFHEWNDFINVVYSFYSKNQDDGNKPLFSVFIDDSNKNIGTDFSQTKIYIGCIAKEWNQLKNMKFPYIISTIDEKDAIPIKINYKSISEINLTLEKQNEISNIEKNIVDNKLKIKNTNTFIDDLAKEIEKLDSFKEETDNYIFQLNECLIYISDVSKKDLEKDIDFKDKFENLNEEINEFLNRNNIQIKDNDLDNQLPTLKNHSNELNNLKKDKENKKRQYFEKVQNFKRDNKENENEILKNEKKIEVMKSFKTILQCEINSNWRVDDTDKHFLALNDLIDDKFDWEIAEKNKGKMTIFKRYRNTFMNANKGSYKNPYLLYSIFNTSPIVKNNNEIDFKLVEKYKLNEKQKICITKSINTRDIFYLQGPPGTGKTQTICCIAEHLVANNQTILMTSSTHEAISNFIDRLDENNKYNPNIIFYKYRSLTKAVGQNIENDIYNDENIFPRFIKKSLDFSLKEYDVGLTNLTKSIDKYLSSYESIPQAISEKELNITSDILKTIDKYDVNKLSSYFENRHPRLNKIYERYSKNIIEQAEDVIIDVEIINKYPNIQEERQANQEQLIQYDNILNLLNNLPKSFLPINSIADLNEIKKYCNSKNNDESKQILESYKEFFNSKYKDITDNKYTNDYGINRKKIQYNAKDCTDFINYIVSNNLINVIGITTTSKNTISIKGSEDIDLFSQYPIDIVIIDEISKSSTPEIIQRAILAKKVLFVGDYKQLPPHSDFNDDEIEEIRNDIHLFPNKYEKYISDFSENKCMSNSKDEELFSKYIIDLYKTSFFATQVMDLKSDSKSSTEKNYDFLNVQHRFTKEIMECVNLFYDNDEKLIMPKTPKKFNQYKLLKRDDSFQIVDTSYLTNDFVKIIKKHNPNLSFGSKNETFDQTSSIMTKSNSNNPSVFNEFNAFIICKVIKNLIRENNSNELRNNIGIITVTQNQKNIVRNMLMNDEYGIGIDRFKELSIRIDTVDNFQGREKDIVIVDLVRARGRYDSKSESIRYEDKRNLDFYKSPERLNVALSRAKSKLIIVGTIENYLSKEILMQLNNDKTTKVKVAESILKIALKNSTLFRSNELEEQ